MTEPLQPTPDDATLPGRAEVTRAAASDGTTLPAKPQPQVRPQSTVSQLHARERYALGCEVARGGMGAILRATDLSIDRTVAMKVALDQASADAEILQRFTQEAKLTGQLEHPNIVPVYDLSSDEQDRTFYTMKFVQGTTLHDILAKLWSGDAATVVQYSLAHLLTIFQKVCDAVAFAHSRNVIHRDLKPANIMVGEYGEVLVMDWGLAKVVGEKRSEVSDQKSEAGSQQSPISDLEFPNSASPGLTLDGQIMGSPQYMAPEQADGEIDKLDARTDIFALGGVLYNILTLHPPVSGKSVEEMLEQIRTGAILPPTSYNPKTGRKATGTIKVGEKTFPQPPLIPLRHCPGGRIPESLGAVAMKALALKREDRYQNVPELQKDIEAYQGGFATRAEHASAWRQLALLIKRHQKEFALAAVALLVLVATVAGFLVKVTKEKNRAEANEKRAEGEEKRAVAAEQRTQKEMATAVAAKEAEIAERKKADERERQARRLLYDSHMSNLIDSFDDAPMSLITGTLQEYEGKTGPDDFRGFEWYYLSKRCRGYRKQFAAYCAAAFNGQGEIIAIDRAGSLHILDPETGKEKVIVKGIGLGSTHARVASSRDGKRIATGLGTKVVLFSPDGDVQALTGHTNRVWGVAFNPDGSLLASASEDGTVRIWDMAAMKCIRTLDGDPDGLMGVTFSPDGRLLAATSGKQLGRVKTRPVFLWNTNTWEQRARFEGHSQTLFIPAIGFAPDSKLLYTAASELKAWSTDDCKLMFSKKLQDHARHLALSPAGDLMALALLNNKLVLFETAGMECVHTFRGHSEVSWCVAFSPDGQLLFSSGGAPESLLWDVKAAVDPLTIQAATLTDAGQESGRVSSNAPSDIPYPPVFVKNGTGVVYPHEGGKILSEFSATTAQPLRTVMSLPSGEVDGLFAEPESDVLAVFLPERLSLHSLVDGKQILDIKTQSRSIRCLAYSTTGKLFAVSSCTHPENPGLLQIFSLESKQEIFSKQFTPGIRAIAFAADGKRLAISQGIWSNGRSIIHVREIASGKVMAGEWRLPNRIGALAFSRNGRLLFGGGYDGIVHAWNLGTGKEELTMKGHTSEVRVIAVSPDGRNLATGDDHGEIKLWDHETGQVCATLRTHENGVSAIYFSADNMILSSIDNRGTIRHWRAK